MNVFQLISEDLKVNSHAKSKFILIFFRLSHASLNTPPVIRKLLMPFRILYRIIVDWFMAVDIPCKTKIGRRLQLYHSHALVINEAAIIGDDCILRHCVTIGNKMTEHGDSLASCIGNKVEFGAGAVVIGDVDVGDNAKIGALAVVTRSVEKDAIMVGNPARSLKSNV